ncbi:MAG: TetR/AcrR family transcriptional regulator [Bacteroidia bacterium]
MNIKHDKELVLKTGLKLFCTKGYNSLGVDEICKVSGMTKGAFYNAFKSKEQFLVHSLLLYSENNLLRISKELATNKQISAFDKLKSFYVKMFEAQVKNNFTGCFINNTMSELGVTNELVSNVTTTEYNKIIETIIPTVIAAQNEGNLTNDISAKEITELLHATFYGLLTIAKSTRNTAQAINTFNTLYNNLKINKNE